MKKLKQKVGKELDKIRSLRSFFKIYQQKEIAHPTVSTVYHNSEQAWAGMLELILSAKKTIDIEQFIFVPDTIGNAFIEAIAEKARRGVRVRMVIDMIGSRSLYYSDIPSALRDIGVEIEFFNPINFNPLYFWNVIKVFSFFDNFFRDHRKMLIVDDEKAIIGGVGVRDDMRTWRDNSVLVEGDFVKNISHAFVLSWNKVHKSHIKIHQQKYVPFFHKKFELLLNSPKYKQRHLYHSFVNNVRRAQSSITIGTPYFIPDNRMMRVLKLACKRGVDVRLIMPEIVDYGVVHHARRWYVTELLKAGGRVYLYKKEFFHSKYLLIDNEWGTTGSANMDNLSFRFNHEVNIATTDDIVLGMLYKLAETDIKNSTEVRVKQWLNRPFVDRVKEFLAQPLHIVL